MGRDLGLADRLRAAGLTVVEVDGWRDRGSTSFDPRGAVNHHTAGGASGSAPSLGTVVNGRPDLPGPLCHVLQSRETAGDDWAYVVAAGRANHAGEGSWMGLSGNSSVWGLEIEHTGTAPLGQARQAVAARIHAAMFGGDPGYLCQHAEWAKGRKIDAATDVDPDAFRDLYAAARAGGLAPPQQDEDDMPVYVEFIRDPRDGGIYITFGTMHRRRLYGDELGNMQAHWAAKGADTAVHDWSPADVDAIPDVTPAR